MIDQEGNYPKSCFIEYDPETNKYCFTIEQFDYAIQECDSQRYIRADIAEQRIRELESAVKLALDLSENGLIDYKKHGLTCHDDIEQKYRNALEPPR